MRASCEKGILVSDYFVHVMQYLEKSNVVCTVRRMKINQIAETNVAEPANNSVIPKSFKHFLVFY